MTSLSPDLAVINGTPRVSSLAIAEHFQKRHAAVLEAIRKIALECPPEFNEPNFWLVEYTDEKGEGRPMYQLSRDGFTLLAMGFAGKKALAWKIKYIEAFNAMEKALADQTKKKALREPKQKALPVSTDRFEPFDYWEESAKMHTRICETATHVLNACERMLNESKRSLAHSKRLLEYDPR